jgi:hypothetical protein
MVQRRHPASSDLPPPTAAVLHSPIKLFSGLLFIPVRSSEPKNKYPP